MKFGLSSKKKQKSVSKSTSNKSNPSSARSRKKVVSKKSTYASRAATTTDNDNESLIGYENIIGALDGLTNQGNQGNDTNTDTEPSDDIDYIEESDNDIDVDDNNNNYTTPDQLDIDPEPTPEPTLADDIKRYPLASKAPAVPVSVAPSSPVSPASPMSQISPANPAVNAASSTSSTNSASASDRGRSTIGRGAMSNYDEDNPVIMKFENWTEQKVINYCNSFSGKILNDEHGPYILSDSSHDILALLDSGYLFVATGKEYDPMVEYILGKIPKPSSIVDTAASALDKSQAQGGGNQSPINPNNPLSLSAVQAASSAESSNFILRKKYSVPPEALKRFYELYAANRKGLEMRKNISTRRLKSRTERKIKEIFEKAAAERASDIHVACSSMEGEVLFRIDGRMFSYSKMTREECIQFFNSCYFFSDESEGGQYDKMAYQPTRISGLKFVLPAGVQALRLQFAPLSNDGSYLVVRILYRDSITTNAGDSEMDEYGNLLHSLSDVDELGYADFQVKLIQSLRRKPFGINIISGVTGSGKSTTLQKSLKALIEERAGSINVITIEDPPEYVIEQARQFPVHGSSDQRNEGFTNAIDSALRADPDVIMIGEIRDKDSASLAIKASLTGHQVWTTLHATNAIRSLERLIEEGIEKFRILDSDVVTGLVGQRLLPVLCDKCKVSYKDAYAMGRFDRPTSSSSSKLAHSTFLSDLRDLFNTHADQFLELSHFVSESGENACDAPGCRHGVTGRTVVAEVLVPTREFMDIYRNQSASDAEQYWLDKMQGFTMAEHALLKILMGLCDPYIVSQQVGLFDIKPNRFDYVWDMYCDVMHINK